MSPKEREFNPSNDVNQSNEQQTPKQKAEKQAAKLFGLVRKTQKDDEVVCEFDRDMDARVILGVPEGASRNDELRAARYLGLYTHPDRVGLGVDPDIQAFVFQQTQNALEGQDYKQPKNKENQQTSSDGATAGRSSYQSGSSGEIPEPNLRNTQKRQKPKDVKEEVRPFTTYNKNDKNFDNFFSKFFPDPESFAEFVYGEVPHYQSQEDNSFFGKIFDQLRQPNPPQKPISQEWEGEEHFVNNVLFSLEAKELAEYVLKNPIDFSKTLSGSKGDQSVDGCNILQLVTQFRPDVADVALNKIQNENPEKRDEILNHRNEQGETPLMMAMKNLEIQPDIVGKMIDSGANPIMTNKVVKDKILCDATALHYASDPRKENAFRTAVSKVCPDQTEKTEKCEPVLDVKNKQQNEQQNGAGDLFSGFFGILCQIKMAQQGSFVGLNAFLGDFTPYKAPSLTVSIISSSKAFNPVQEYTK